MLREEYKKNNVNSGGSNIRRITVIVVEVQGFKPLGYLSLLPQAGVSLYDWIAPAIVYIV